MNFAKNIAKRWKKSDEIKRKREEKIKERNMAKKADIIATNSINQANKEEAKEEKKPIDLDRKVSIITKKTNENGIEMDVENLIPICFLPSCGENWKEAAKLSNITEEEIAAIEKWYAENSDKVIKGENNKEE